MFRRFDCTFLVSNRQWGRLVTYNDTKHDALLWYAGFKPAVIGAFRFLLSIGSLNGLPAIHTSSCCAIKINVSGRCTVYVVSLIHVEINTFELFVLSTIPANFSVKKGTFTKLCLKTEVSHSHTILKVSIPNFCDPLWISELADCGDPSVPVHGSKTGNNYKAGGTITFACDTGYHLEGPTNLRCLKNGTWDNTMPKCKKTDIAFYVLNCE